MKTYSISVIIGRIWKKARVIFLPQAHSGGFWLTKMSGGSKIHYVKKFICV